jgi:hypothetical protein
MVYQIRIEGHLGDQWAEWFGNVIITLESNGNTLLDCPEIDQAGLHGLLKKIRDLGMPLISVKPLEHESRINANTNLHNRSEKETNT